MIEIYNEDCFETMQRMKTQGVKCDVVLTSPPYNVGRNQRTKRAFNNYDKRYDIYIDDKTQEEYIDWTEQLFNAYDGILVQNGVVLYNVSYGSENNPSCMWLSVAEIIKRTSFMVADCIVWKKRNALPNNSSKNKLTRITEFVFVFCRKTEYKTYSANKKVRSVSPKGQRFYENIFNFVEARNNDGKNPFNNATYSSELCEKLLNMYAPKNSLIYDSFMGTGTTAVACKRMGLSCIGSELSKNQCDFAEKRLADTIQQLSIV